MNSVTFEEIIKKDGKLVYKTRGTSMQPMLRQGRDLVIIEPLKRRPQVFDIVLYRRKDGAHVLHRIIKVRKSDYIIRGDHTYLAETGITDEDIEGILTGFVRNGKQYRMSDPAVRLYGRLWHLIFPLRWLCWRFYRFLQVQVLGKEANSGTIQQNNKEAWATACNLCSLLACAVRNEIPDQVMIDSLNLTDLLNVSENHSVSAAAGMALDSAGVNDPGFRHAIARAVRNTALMDHEREMVYQRLEKEGIWYAPLKGALIKDLYPKYGMREMSDTDILVDESRFGEVRALMSELGFEFVKEEEAHDVFTKSPNCTFEIHRKLFNPKSVPVLEQYFSDVRNKLNCSEGSLFRLEFSPDDLYIYHLAHEWKHFDGAGTGLRSLMDTYVLLRQFEDLPCQQYVKEKLDKLGIRDFEEQNRMLTLHLFEGGELNDSARKMGERIISAGTFGSADLRVSRKVEQYGGSARGKVRYLLRRVFLPNDLIRARHPFFWKYRFLIPLLPIYRLALGLKRYRGSILKEIRALFRLRTDKK